MQVGGFKRFENFIIKKWYISAPLALIPILTFSSLGLSLDAHQLSPSDQNSTAYSANSDDSRKSQRGDINKNPKSVKGAVSPEVAVSCDSGESMTAGLSGAVNLVIRKLYQYEKLCGSRVAGTLMVFTGMPTNESNAKLLAGDMAVTLKEFAKYSLHPLVVMEPTTASGIIDFQKFNQGSYDSAFNSYFSTLKSKGVTDAKMGTWVPLPESNIPEWGSTNPSLFSANFVRAANIQKKHFPNSKISIILDSLSYPPGELDWDGGAYVSLAPYLKGIPKGLVDSFGYQGFPWAAPANEPNYSNYDAGKFLKPGIAKEAAQLLGTKHIWLNTGTFRTFHSNDPSKEVIASTTLRTQILNDIVTQADWLKRQGFKVTVSLFAENKSDTAEAVDWSYWSGNNLSGAHASALKSFLSKLRSKSIGFWLFDSL